MNKNQNHNVEPFRLYEVMEGRHYESAIMPSEGDPFEAFAMLQASNPRLSLVEVVNGQRRTVIEPVQALPREIEEEVAEFDEWQDEFGD